MNPLLFELWQQWSVVTLDSLGLSKFEVWMWSCPSKLKSLSGSTCPELVHETAVDALSWLGTIEEVRAHISSVSHSAAILSALRYNGLLLYTMQTNYTYCGSHNFKFLNLFACKNLALIMLFYI